MLLITPPFMAKREIYRIYGRSPLANRIIETQDFGMQARYAAALREVFRQSDAPLADTQAEGQRQAANGLETDVWLINGLNHPNPRGHKRSPLPIFHALLLQRSMAS